MSFSVAPKAAPASQAPHPSAQGASDRRAKAIAMISGVQAPDPHTAPPVEAAKPRLDASSPDPVQNTISETPPEVVEAAAPAKAPEEPLSSQYAQLARKEKALRSQAQQVKAQNDALAAREAAIKAKESELNGDSYIKKDRISTETLKVLEEAGLSYEQITQMMLNGPSQEAQQQASMISKLEAKIAALEEGQNKTTKNFEDSQKNAYTQAVNQIRNEAKRAVYTNPEYETIKETNSVNDVVDLITQTFENGLDEAHPKGTLLTVDEAAVMVEEHLAEEAFKLTNLSKIKKRLAAATVATVPSTTSGKLADKTSGEKQPATMKTLTNRDGTARKLSASERAVLVFRGELKQ